MSARLKAACPRKGGVEGNVPGTDEEDEGRGDEQSKGDGSAIVDELVTDNGVQKE